MNFEIDSDTFNDLEVFSERSGSKSIYSIFNRTRTLGARELLMEMMHEPFSEINSLIDRRDSIKYFYEEKIELEITNNQLDFIEHYLIFNKRCLRNNFADALFDSLYNKIQTTPDYYTITTGIKKYYTAS